MCFIFGKSLRSINHVDLILLCDRTKRYQQQNEMNAKKDEEKRSKCTRKNLLFFFTLSWWVPRWHLGHLHGSQLAALPYTFSINLLVPFNVWSNYMYKLCQPMHVLTHIALYSSFTIFLHVFCVVFFLLLSPLWIVVCFRSILSFVLLFYDEWPHGQTDDFVFCNTQFMAKRY